MGLALFHPRRLILPVAACALLALAGVAAFSGGRGRPHPLPVADIRLGVATILDSAPLFVAEQNGYFADERLRVELKPFSSGRTALQEMLAGADVDAVTTGQMPVVVNSFDSHAFSIIAGLQHSSSSLKILARSDRGIGTPADLRGKTIGAVKGSTGHYFLGLFLARHGMTIADVTFVDIEGSSLSQALVDGRVDAISSIDSDTLVAQQLLPETSVLFASEGIFRGDRYLVGMNDWQQKNPQAVVRLLRAIDRAEGFIADHPEEAKDIVSRRLAINREFLASVWDHYVFTLFLDQAVLLSLEQQARWMIENGFIAKTAVPNYLRFLSADALEIAKPGTVTLIH